MRVLVACEYSGVVRDAFLKKGHYAWSCDLLPTESPGPHFQKDVLDVLSENTWDLLIAHPPCTYICHSGWHWTVREIREGITTRHKKFQEGAHFFVKLLQAGVPRICIENPQPSGALMRWTRKYDQAVQPYYFGDDASKRTCLWLKGLDPLVIPPRKIGLDRVSLMDVLVGLIKQIVDKIN